MQNEYLGKLSFEESIRKVKEFGLNYVECSVLWFRNINISKAKELFLKHQVKISAINTWHEPQSLKEKKDYVLEGIKIADELEVKYVIVYFGNLSIEPTIEIFEEFIHPCLLEAEKRGVILALETEFDISGKDITRTAVGCLKIIEKINSDYLKVNFDPGNIYIAGEEPFPYAYEMLKDHIAYIHLKDAVKYDPSLYGSEENNLIFEDISGKYICVPVGKGAINYEGFLESLLKNKYQGFLTVEPHVVRDKLDEAFISGIKYVKKRLKSYV